MDSGALASALEHIRDRGLPIHSLLIVRHGRLVLEAYFYPYDGKTPHAWASVSKSITSALVGKAIAEGHMRSLTQPIADFFPEYRAAFSDAKRRITVEHLLKMASGFDCGYKPGEPEVVAMERSTDFVRAALELPVVKEPGGEFSYCSGGSHLLSAIVTRSTRMSALEYGRQRLFRPLGITDVAWPADPQGNNHGWSDLRMHPRDMAKIGYLYMRRGRWCGEQIIPTDWVRRSTTRQIVTHRAGEDYGYQWWVLSGEFSGVYEARGRGEQYLTVWPQQDLIIVTNGGGAGAHDLVPFFRSALRADRALPQNAQAYQQLKGKIAAADLAPAAAPVRKLPPLARAVSGQVYQFDPNYLDLKTLSLRFTTQDDMMFELRRSRDAIVARAGLDGIYRFSTPEPSRTTAAARGEWKSDNEFVVDYTEADGINHFRLDLLFDDDKLTMDLEDLTRHFPAQRIHAAATSN